MGFWSTETEAKRTANQAILLATFSFLLLALLLYISNEIKDNVQRTYYDISGLGEYYDLDYPNLFSLQHVLTDQNRKAIQFNTAVDMRAESFSARTPIKIHANLIMLNETLPKGESPPEKMYVSFIGSRDLNTDYTGLGRGYYAGYVEATKYDTDDGLIHYASDSDIILYEMGGQYPVIISSAAPAIVAYNRTELSLYPEINIGGEEITHGLENEKSAERSDNINLSLTLVVVALSIVSTKPVVGEIIEEHFSSKNARSIGQSKGASPLLQGRPLTKIGKLRHFGDQILRKLKLRPSNTS